jgi:hypothetical protein
MALMRLGRRDEARTALEEASNIYRAKVPRAIALDPGVLWIDLLLCEILHSEAEALVLFDPIFPANPFAPSFPEG